MFSCSLYQLKCWNYCYHSNDSICLFHIKCTLLQFIHKTVGVSHSNPLHKPDDTLSFDCALHFYTVFLHSYSLNKCMHLPCVFECLFMFELPHAFWTKINKICKREFSVCLTKQVQSWISALQLATYWTNARKTFASFSKK